MVTELPSVSPVDLGRHISSFLLSHVAAVFLDSITKDNKCFKKYIIPISFCRMIESLLWPYFLHAVHIVVVAFFLSALLKKFLHFL